MLYEVITLVIHKHLARGFVRLYHPSDIPVEHLFFIIIFQVHDLVTSFKGVAMGLNAAGRVI